MNKTSNRSNDSRLPWVLLTFFMLAGLALRTYQLGKFGFWTDELLHVIGAKSVLEAGTPVVIGKGEYTRAYPITLLTAILFKYVGESESIARFPYVLVNMLFVFVGFVLVKRTFDVKVALIFSFIMAFSPFEISMSRECRMYSTFQLLYFSGSMMFFAGMEPDTLDSRRRIRAFRKVEDALNINVYYLFFSFPLFLISMYFHELTYNFVFAAMAYFILMTVVVSFDNGIRKGIFSKYALFLFIIFVIFLSLFLYSPGFLNSRLDMASSLPEWAQEGKAYSYYWAFFVKNYPFFIYGYMLSMFLMIRKYGKHGIFLLASFLPLIFMHSFIYTGRVSERYIFYIFPFFVLGSSYLIMIFVDYARDQLRELYSGKSYFLMSVMLFCMIPAFYLIGKPWIGEIRSIHNKYNWSDWKSASKELRSIPENSVVIATRIKNVYYYLGRMPDYNVRKSMFEISKKDVQVGNKTLPINLIMDRDTLEEISNKSDDVYFLADRWSFNLSSYMDVDMRDFVKENFVLVPHGGSKSIMIMKYTGKKQND